MKDPIYIPEREEMNGSGADCCLNLYSACNMRCTFCDVRTHRHSKMTAEEYAACTKPREGILRALIYQLSKWKADGEPAHNVLLSPLCDPYPLIDDTTLTRSAIEVIHEYGHHVTILTRNPDPRDFDLLDDYDTYGVSLCCRIDLKDVYEPKAPAPVVRVARMMMASMRSKCATMLYIAPLVDAQFAIDSIKHIDVNRYVIVRPRDGKLPVKGNVTDDELRELVESKGRMIAFEHKRIWRKTDESNEIPDLK